MAVYHCSIKSGSKGKGASGKAKADYICREGKYADKPDLQYKESGNMPKWAQSNPRTFWKASDKNERANGRVYTEIEVSLPRDYSLEDHKKLVQGFVKDQLPEQPYTFAIHKPRGLDGEEQPHAHIIFSERKLDGIDRDKEQFFKRANTKEPEKGGCAKDRRWNDRDKVQAVREAWETHHNKAVYDMDIVSCKSLKAQGIDREPEPKLGPKGMYSPAVERVQATRKLHKIDREIRKLEEELAAEKSTPQNIVVEPQPQKTGIPPTTEPKTDKIQEVVQTPDTTRRGDPDQLQTIFRDTRSSTPVQKTKLVNPSVVPVVPEAHSEALPPVTKTNQPIQQPAVESEPSTLTAAELAYHVMLRRIAAISEKFIELCKRLDAKRIKEETYNTQTAQLEADLLKLIKPYPGIKINLPYDDTPIIVNGQPITGLVAGLPPEQKAEPQPLTRTQGRSR